MTGWETSLGRRFLERKDSSRDSRARAEAKKFKLNEVEGMVQLKIDFD